MTDLLLRVAECTIDIIVRPPDPRDTVLVVPEALLEVCPELAKEDGVRGLFLDLGAERKPCTLAKRGQGSGVLLVRAVETWKSD